MSNFNKHLYRFGSIVTLLICLSCALVKAEKPKPEQLNKIWFNKDTTSSERVKALNQIIWDQHLFTNPDTALILTDSMLVISARDSLLFGLAEGHSTKGVAYAIKGNYPLALDQFLNGLRVAEAMQDDKLIADLSGNISNVYRELYEYEKSKEYLYKCIEVAEQNNDVRALSNSMSNLAGIYNEQGDYEKALEYASKGLTYEHIKNDPIRHSRLLHNIGTIYQYLENYDSAIYYQSASLAIRDTSEDKLGRISSRIGLGNAYIGKGQAQKGIDYCKQTEQMLKEFNSDYQEGKYCECLTTGYEKLGRHDLALQYYKRLDTLNKRMDNESNQKKVIQSQYQYEMEKQHVSDSLYSVQREQLNQVEFDKQIQSRNLILVSIVIGLILLSVFAYLMYRRYKVTNEQKHIIESQHQELEKKNSEIQASINYAQRIQNAVLPEKELHQLFNDAFLIYQPKDIVSGDFYWWEEKENLKLFTVADCTGHGVPGGFVSMLGTIFLNEIFNSKGLRQPNKILDELNHLVQITLRDKTGTTIKDGMDISFACLNMDTLELTWAGANNPLYVIRKAEEGYQTEVEIYKADRKPIGVSGNENPFTVHHIQLAKGDLVYLFSDGYADQFGGPESKKLGYKRFRSILTDAAHRELKDQKQILENYFDIWKEYEDQIDDVCIIGVRL